MINAVAALPFVDEHAITVAAPHERVWVALGQIARGSLAARRSELGARLLGCRDTGLTGPLLEPGSTIPGFRVASALPGEELVLEGEHRFSRYSLTFRLDPARDGGTRVTAETRAAFPGLHGRVYRAAVIGTRGHVVMVRRLLRSVSSRAEGSAGYR
jgi:hypothetical protein